jgi:hypothetical protein
MNKNNIFPKKGLKQAFLGQIGVDRTREYAGPDKRRALTKPVRLRG